jgi:hypothetical protein
VREPSRFQLWYGRDEPPVETRELRAGPLVARLEGIDLRYVRVGGVEAIRRLFVAVRDDAWGTLPPRVSNLEVDAGADSFRVSFEAYHEAGDLRFRWHGELAGGSDGSLDCRMDGVAESDFGYNRIGFCVLHPRENAGRPYRARTPGAELEGTLPDTIGPQRSENGQLFPLFPSYDRLELELATGLWARLEFEGDLFEMEDQRNWTDASFKTYSTPITLGFPHHARAGQEIRQRVRLTFDGAEGLEPVSEGGPVRIRLGAPTGRPLPALGLGMASHDEPLSEREAELLRLLELDHLRVDRIEDLARARDDAQAVGTGLEVAVFDQLAEDVQAARYVVFDPDLIGRVRERLGSDAELAAGTDGWFVDINRDRPDLSGADAVAYSTTATVHADDETSVAETPSAQGDTVRSAAALWPGLRVVVGPVTLRPRLWPFGSFGSGELPYQVDPRQPSLFAAAWTAASLKHLAEAGAAAVTYFETTGWRGVMETEAGSPRPDLFASRPGQVFPLFHVLADAAEWKEGELVEATSSAPLVVEALALRDGGLHVLVANLTPRTQRATIGPLPDSITVRVLDETTAVAAGDRPEEFRARTERVEARDGVVELQLRPYAVARLDA